MQNNIVTVYSSCTDCKPASDTAGTRRCTEAVDGNTLRTDADHGATSILRERIRAVHADFLIPAEVQELDEQLVAVLGLEVRPFRRLQIHHRELPRAPDLAPGAVDAPV